MNDDPNRRFTDETELLSFVEGQVKQLNMRLNDLEKSQLTESEEDFEKRWKGIEREIVKLQNLIKQNYVRFAGSSEAIANWDDIEMYSWASSLMTRLTEIRDTNTEGV